MVVDLEITISNVIVLVAMQAQQEIYLGVGDPLLRVRFVVDGGDGGSAAWMSTTTLLADGLRPVLKITARGARSR